MCEFGPVEIRLFGSIYLRTDDLVQLTSSETEERSTGCPAAAEANA